MFVMQVFLCQLVDAYSEMEYIALKNVSKNCYYFKVNVWFLLTELQQKDEKMFTLMSSSQKCHAVNVLHAWSVQVVVFSVALWSPCPWFWPHLSSSCFSNPCALYFSPFFMRCIFRTGSAPSRSMLLFPSVEINMEGTCPFLWFQLNKKKGGLLSGFALLAESGAASALYKWTIYKS